MEGCLFPVGALAAAGSKFGGTCCSMDTVCRSGKAFVPPPLAGEAVTAAVGVDVREFGIVAFFQSLKRSRTKDFFARDEFCIVLVVGSRTKWNSYHVRAVRVGAQRSIIIILLLFLACVELRGSIALRWRFSIKNFSFS